MIVDTCVKRGLHLFDYGLQSQDPTNPLNHDDSMRKVVDKDSIVWNKFAKVAREWEHDELLDQLEGWKCREPNSVGDVRRVLENELQSTTQQMA